MKKNIYLLLISYLALATSSCDENNDIKSLKCGSTEFKIVEYVDVYSDDYYFLGEIADSKGRMKSSTSMDVEVSFVYDSATYDKSGVLEEPIRKEKAVLVPAGTTITTVDESSFLYSSISLLPSGKVTEYDNGQWSSYHITLISVSIQPETCGEATEKSAAEVAEDSEEFGGTEECDALLTLNITLTDCEPFLISWEKASEDVDLSDAILYALGKEIDLSGNTSVSYPFSELHFDELDFSITGGNVCGIETSLSKCTGTTGTVTLTDPIAGGEDLIVTVTDPDLAGGADFDLTVTSSLGETETVTLAETESGIFVGTLTTLLSNEAGQPEDGTLNIENDVTISVSYDDEFDGEGNDPEAITVTVMVSGDFAPSCSDGIQNGDEIGIDCGGSCEACITGSVFTYSGSQYGIDYGSEWFADMLMGTYTASYNFAKSENDASGLAIDFTLKSDSPITSGTYTYDASTTGIEAGATIAVDNASNDVTGGSVTLTIEANSDYTFVMNLTTASGSLTGTYTIPAGNVYSNL